MATDGVIATCPHVVSSAQQITVTLSDGTKSSGTIVGMDTVADLAVVHIDRTGLTPIAFGRSGDLRVRDLVVAVGNALALAGGPTASLGIGSALDRLTSADSWSASTLTRPVRWASSYPPWSAERWAVQRGGLSPSTLFERRETT